MADVVALHKGGEVSSDGRQALLDAVALSFDQYVKDQGEEPNSIAYVVGTMGRRTRTGWLMRNADEGLSTAFLLSAGAHLTKDGLGL